MNSVIMILIILITLINQRAVASGDKSVLERVDFDDLKSSVDLIVAEGANVALFLDSPGSFRIQDLNDLKSFLSSRTKTMFVDFDNHYMKIILKNIKMVEIIKKLISYYPVGLSKDLWKLLQHKDQTLIEMSSKLDDVQMFLLLGIFIFFYLLRRADQELYLIHNFKV